jgi:MFS family permease
MFVIGIYVRRFSTETPEFQTARAERSAGKIPLLEVLQRYPKEVILTSGIYMVNQANFYITVVFIVSYAVGTLRVPFQTMLIGTTIASFVQVFALAGFGALSDRVGRIPLMMAAAIGLMMIVFPLFAVVQTKDGVLIAIALTVALIVNAAFFGPLAALYAETFAAEVRYSGISLGANIGSILGGGLTLSVSAALMRHFDGAVWPVCLYVIGITFIGTICLNFMRRRTDSHAPLTNKSGR